MASGAPETLVRAALVRKVQRLFNDPARGERPVERSENALFRPDTTIWRVHGDVTTMMIGGVAALLLQMLHPAALSGVWDHSNFRQDMLGRLRRTARFIAVTTYADRTLAEVAIERVRTVHAAVRGLLPDGTRYRADDPRLLAWVHVCEARCFLDAWIAYSGGRISQADQDSYFAEAAVVARLLGADPVPVTRAEAGDLLTSYRPSLTVDHRTRDVARLILHPRPATPLDIPVQRLLLQAAVDLLPPWARTMHGLPHSGIGAPLVQSGAASLAGILRWAFRSTTAPTTAIRSTSR